MKWNVISLTLYFSSSIVDANLDQALFMNQRKETAVIIYSLLKNTNKN